MTVQKSFYFIASVTLIIVGCKSTQPTPTTTTLPPAKPIVDCGTEIPTYAVDIKPIMDQHCNSCHGENSPGGYNFSTMDNTMRAAQAKAFLGSIKHEGHYDQMPARAAKLDDLTIRKIECWVNTGMK